MGKEQWIGKNAIWDEEGFSVTHEWEACEVIQQACHKIRSNETKAKWAEKTNKCRRGTKTLH